MTRIFLMMLLLSDGSCFPHFVCRESTPTVYICNDVLGGDIFRLAGPLLEIEKTDPDKLAARALTAEVESGNATGLRVVVWRNELDSLTRQRLRNQGILIRQVPQARDGNNEAGNYLRLKMLHDFLVEQFPTHAADFEHRLTKELQRLKKKAQLRQANVPQLLATIDTTTLPPSPIP